MKLWRFCLRYEKKREVGGKIERGGGGGGEERWAGRGGKRVIVFLNYDIEFY